MARETSITRTVAPVIFGASEPGSEGVSACR